ncbi:MFS transporter [Colwellia sp. MSW7]|uniref:MFS transporter n=1 Tax=Colwellia maritima TaxID=2912588 RepID=A0ABS9X5Q0_9GAMM|nr:MFS transporter [Colwellia maritima]MCI2285556.1 MFS transporter [Colwellia maritima]
MSLFTRLSTSYFFYFAILGLISPYLSVFLDGKGFNSVELGEIFAILTATKIVAPSLWAILADKTGQKLLIIRLGALPALLSFIVLFWLNSYWPISFCLALFSLFWTAILPQLEVFTLTSVRHSSKIYARIRLWGSLGFVALAVFAGQVMEYYTQVDASNSIISSFTDAFVLMGGVILLCLLLSTMVIKPQRMVNKVQQQALAITGKLLEPRFVIFFISGVLLQISFGPYYGFFALFLRDLAYPGFAVGLLISLGVVAEILVFIFASNFFKAFSLKTILIFSLAATALRWFLVALYADSIWLLAFTQLLHAASFALFHSASMVFISEHFTRCQQSRGQAVYLGGVYGVGGAIGAYVAGVLWLDGLGASTAFLTASGTVLFAALLMWFMPAQVKQKSPVK